MPMPCFIPLLQSPSYYAPDRKQYLPQPLISSSIKHPEYFYPDWQTQSPHPLFIPFYISPSQMSPFLYLILNRLFPKSSLSIYSYSLSTYSELFVYSYCQAGTGSSIYVYSVFLIYFFSLYCIYCSPLSSSFVVVMSVRLLDLGSYWPKKVLQLM